MAGSEIYRALIPCAGRDIAKGFLIADNLHLCTSGDLCIDLSILNDGLFHDFLCAIWLDNGQHLTTPCRQLNLDLCVNTSAAGSHVKGRGTIRVRLDGHLNVLAGSGQFAHCIYIQLRSAVLRFDPKVDLRVCHCLHCVGGQRKPNTISPACINNDSERTALPGILQSFLHGVRVNCGVCHAVFDLGRYRNRAALHLGAGIFLAAQAAALSAEAVRSQEPAVPVLPIAQGRILRISCPIVNLIAVVVDVVPDHSIPIMDLLILQSIAGMLAVDGVHPAAAPAVRKFGQRISAQRRGSIDGGNIVLRSADACNPGCGGRLDPQVIDCRAFLQLHTGGGNPGHIVRHVLFCTEIYILRRKFRADQSERNRNGVSCRFRLILAPLCVEICRQISSDFAVPLAALSRIEPAVKVIAALGSSRQRVSFFIRVICYFLAVRNPGGLASIQMEADGH